ncbi:VanZ family protein [Saccharopolyspora taberi]|uniref:VanZ-like domain-containing protein n=1 Tax=Saccharopolyspora taberi TaxID=60895 RepID=A0ABN3VEU7_9PSEU
MITVWQSWGHVLLAAAFALPPAVLAVVVLARWRAGSEGAVRRSVAEVGAVVGTLPWLWMVLTPRPGEPELALVPLRDLVDQLYGRPVAATVQIAGNLLVLAAFGAFLPMRFAALSRPHRIAVAAAAVSLAIELLQYALRLGRVSSVDDVLLNTAGAVLSSLLTQRWRRT